MEQIIFFIALVATIISIVTVCFFYKTLPHRTKYRVELEPTHRNKLVDLDKQLVDFIYENRQIGSDLDYNVVLTEPERSILRQYIKKEQKS